MLPSIFGENLLDDLWRNDFDRDWFNMDRELYGKHAKKIWTGSFTASTPRT